LSDTSYRRTGNAGLIQACLVIALILAYLATRLTNLALLPIFTDEAVYILWSQTIAKNISELWLPIRVENNRPLFFWLISVSLKAVDDPLLAGRAVSVLAGFFSLAGVYSISSLLHSRWAGLLAGFVYVASPYHLFFNRMAHKAALLECLFVWLVWLTLRMAQPGTRVGAWQNLLLGLLVALSLLTEATAILFVLLPLPFILLFSKTIPNWKPVILCYLLAFTVGSFPFAYLYFTDDHYQIKNIFIPAFNSMAQTGMSEMILTFPHKIVQNANGVLEHFTAYLTWPVVISAMFFFLISLGNMDRNLVIMSANFFLPVLALMGTAGAGFSRYYLFCATPLLIWGSLGMAEIFSFIKRAFSRNLAYLVLAAGVPLAFTQAGAFDFQLLTSPQFAPLSGTDQYQYISSEHSGYGSLEAIDYLKQISKDKKVAVFTTSNWGVPDDCVTLYLSGSPNVDVFMGFWAFKKPLLPPDMESFDLYDKFTAKHLGKFSVQDLPQDVYFITRTPSVSRSFFLGMNDNFQLIQSFRKPIGTNTIDIYKLIRP
jgi:hypothetical protein